KYRPLLAAMAGNIFHVGGAGAGCTAKLVTQYLGYTNFVAALEGMLIGAKAGIDLGVLAQIVPLSAGASRTFDNIPRSVLPAPSSARRPRRWPPIRRKTPDGASNPNHPRTEDGDQYHRDQQKEAAAAD